MRSYGTGARDAHTPGRGGRLPPDFTLPSQDGEPVMLSDLIGETAIVLYVYPKDNSLGYTAEACAFRDSHAAFAQVGARVIGVSSEGDARVSPCDITHKGAATQHPCRSQGYSDALYKKGPSGSTDERHDSLAARWCSVR